MFKIFHVQKNFDIDIDSNDFIQFDKNFIEEQ